MLFGKGELVNRPTSESCSSPLAHYLKQQKVHIESTHNILFIAILWKSHLRITISLWDLKSLKVTLERSILCSEEFSERNVAFFKYQVIREGATPHKKKLLTLKQEIALQRELWKIHLRITIGLWDLLQKLKSHTRKIYSLFWGIIKNKRDIVWISSTMSQ